VNEGNVVAGNCENEVQPLPSDTFRTYYIKAFCDGEPHNCKKDADEDYYYDTINNAVIEIEVVVVKVDLDVDADYDGDRDIYDDSLEDSYGGLVKIGEREEIKIQETLPTTYNADVELTWTSSKIAVYETATGGTPVTSPYTCTSPKTLYVEGVTLSTSQGDETLTLESDDSLACSDEIVFTVIDHALVLQHRDGQEQSVDTQDGDDNEVPHPLYVCVDADGDADMKFKMHDPSGTYNWTLTGTPTPPSPTSGTAWNGSWENTGNLLPGEYTLSSTFTGAGGAVRKIEFSVIDVEFINNSRGGDRVISAKDQALGLPGGIKQLDVKVSPPGTTATLTIRTVAGGNGTAGFQSTGNNTRTVTGTETVTLEGRDLSSSPRDVYIEAEANGLVCEVWEFSVFRVDLTGYDDTTDIMNSNAANAGGQNFATLFQTIFGDKKMGFKLLNGTILSSANRIYIEGKILPAGIVKTDFLSAADGTGFDFKRWVTRRVYTGPVVDNTRNWKDDDATNDDEDLSPDPETRAGATHLYVYDIDFPYLFPMVTDGVTIRARSNFREVLQYAGIICSRLHNWWERQSIEKVAGVFVRDNDFDDGVDDDDDDDNNVKWDATSSLTSDLGAPGALDHFRVVAPSAATVGIGFGVTVIAEDSDGDVVTSLTGNVTLSQTGGTTGSDGPPKVGVHINGTATTTDDEHALDATDAGVYQFSVVDYTAETITKFAASGAGKTGDSGQVVVSP